MILTSGHNLQSNHFGTCVEEFEAFGVVVFSLKKQQLETGGTGGKKCLAQLVTQAWKW